MLRRLAPLLRRYGGAVVVVAGAAALTALLWPALQTTVSTLFVGAVMIAAWYGGLGPGVLATVLSALAIDYYFQEPYYALSFGVTDIVRDVVFVGVALLIGSLNARRKRAEERLQESSALLERRVQERTDDVQRREREARSMLEVSQAVTSSLDLQAVLELIVDRACQLLGAQKFGLATVEDEQSGSVLRFWARRGLSPTFVDRMRPIHWRDGTTPIAISERRTVWTADLLNDPDIPLTPSTRRAVEMEGYHAVLSVPLLVSDRAIGALVMYRDAVGPFTAAEIELLQGLAVQAAIAVENARLFNEQQVRAARLRALARLNQLVSSSLDTAHVLRAIARAAGELMQAPLVSIWTADEAERVVRVRAFSDDAFAGQFPSTVRRYGDGGTGWVALHRRPLNTADVSADDRVAAPEWFERHGLTSALFLPILFEDSLLGVLVLFGRGPFAFRPDQQELLDSFVGQAAVAIRNAQLYEAVRSAHERLAQSQEQLVHSEKLAALGQLVAGIAHELNNPLAAVLGRAYVAERQSESAVVKEHLAKMRQSAERAAEIVRNLLQFSRKTSASLEAVDINALVHSVLDLTASAGVTRHVRVVRQLAPGIPTTWADGARLQQVLLNLVTNAYQAMGATGGVLTITTAADSGVIRLAVADSGPGVPVEIRTRIFDPFFTTKPVGQGTGLGLSVVHGIVAAHEGRIWLDESVMGGARFVVELPLRAAPDTSPVVVSASVPEGCAILVVDDEPEVAEVLRALFELLGAKVAIALSAREARERLAAESFDMVTLDLVMPDVSGADLWRELARDRPEVAARVAFITGNIDPAMQEFVRSTGRPMLAKPYTLEALKALVAEAL